MISTTIAYDAYWQFAAERLAIFFRQRSQPQGPWTNDPILQRFRFTNAYRATDRVSQYLIREVQYKSERSQEPSEVFFRTMLFKMFNKIETWEKLEQIHGPLSWKLTNLDSVEATLTAMLLDRKIIYSAAYIIPPPQLGCDRKHSNHIKLLKKMMNDRLPNRLQKAGSLEEVFRQLLEYPGLGRFLAFQFAIDLNYSTVLSFDEADFVVAGPGALDGISKCFANTSGRSAESIIHWVTERQDAEFSARGIKFSGLFGRPLQPIDCQNLFCEVSKYTRVAHPHIRGTANRLRIKQSYRPSPRKLDALMFPPRWNLKYSSDSAVNSKTRVEQLSLLYGEEGDGSNLPQRHI